MNITKNNLDALNAVITVNVSKEDYQEKVDKTLQNYRDNANIPGFRKGKVPMGMIKKQYGKSIKFEEINKVLQSAVSNYIAEEKLDILGQPLPKPLEELDLDQDNFNFDFEIGLTPVFDVQTDVDVTEYKIVIDDKEIERYIENFRKRFGKLITQETVSEATECNVTISELDENQATKEDGISQNAYLIIKNLKKEASKQFDGKKAGDEIIINAQELFEDVTTLATLLRIDIEKAKTVSTIKIKLNEIAITELAEINQELFDKVYGEGVVESEEAFREKIKNESEAMYESEAKRQFINDLYAKLIEKNSFELPQEFLVKFLLETNEKITSKEQAEQEYSKSEQSLRYQLLEAKLAEKNEIKIEMEDLKNEARNLISLQMKQYGYNPTEEEMEEIVSKSLSNYEEVTRLQQQVLSNKIVDILKNQVKLQTKEVNFEDFIKEVTAQK